MAKKKEPKGRKPAPYQDVNAYSRSLTVSDFNTIYRSLAKRVNQRIRRLDAMKAKTGNMAAIAYLEHIGKSRFQERPRFTEYSDYAIIKKEITIMQNFLNSDRTTKSGRRRILKKTQETYGEKHKLDLNLDTLDEFLDEFDNTKAASNYASDTIVNILSTVTNTETTSETVDKILKEIKDSKSLKDAAKRLARIKEVKSVVGGKNVKVRSKMILKAILAK